MTTASTAIREEVLMEMALEEALPDDGNEITDQEK